MQTPLCVAKSIGSDINTFIDSDLLGSTVTDFGLCSSLILHAVVGSDR